MQCFVARLSVPVPYLELFSDHQCCQQLPVLDVNTRVPMHCRHESPETEDIQDRRRQCLKKLVQSKEWQNPGGIAPHTWTKEERERISTMNDLCQGEHGRRVLFLEQTLDEYCHGRSRHFLEPADDLCQDHSHRVLRLDPTSDKYCFEPSRHNLQLLDRRDKDQVLARYMNQPEISVLSRYINQPEISDKIPNSKSTKGGEGCEAQNPDQGYVVVVSHLIVWRFGGSSSVLCHLLPTILSPQSFL